MKRKDITLFLPLAALAALLAAPVSAELKNNNKADSHRDTWLALVSDTDNDGVTDDKDLCPGTPAGTKVGPKGCPWIADSDGDGVMDDLDQCPGTTAGIKVNSKGCPLSADSDGDGVADAKDQCPNTPAGTKVDAKGCPVPVDSDGDGVTDDKDQCPNTPAGTRVDSKGCPVPVDSDGDGVMDDKDQCPDTPVGTKVGPTGCPESAGEVPTDNWVLKDINFEVNSDALTADGRQVLDGVVAILLPRRNVRIEIQGHTDSTGDEQKNMELSTKRAATVKNYLIGKGVDGSRLETKSYGSSVPVGDNATEEGRAANRRIEFKVLSK